VDQGAGERVFMTKLHTANDAAFPLSAPEGHENYEK
jgi:hypothetical protein